MKTAVQILVIGSGARENAMCCALARSKKVAQVYITAHSVAELTHPKIKSIPIKDYEIQQLIDFAKNNGVDFSVVGPEVPLSLGVVDAFKKAGLKIIGPTQEAAQLESSKSFAKELMKKYQIPTAEFACFSDLDQARAHLKTQRFPIVIKANGLAAGKGVVIAEDLTEGLDCVKAMMQDKKFAEAGSAIVIEQFLKGEEASFMVMVDESGFIELATSQDHKRKLDGDLGPNTGGMGAYSPAPIVTETVRNKVIQRIIEPTLEAMKKEGTPFSGFLYAGLMIDEHQDPYVVEFNTRLGDPETQPVLMRLKGEDDFFNLCLAATENNLINCKITWDSRPCLCVVMASSGYPESSTLNSEIQIPQSLISHNQNNTALFFAGAKLEKGKILTSGGRVLSVCALGNDIPQAQKSAYAVLKQIECKDLFYRTDIGYRAIIKKQ